MGSDTDKFSKKQWKRERLGEILQVIRGVSFPKDAKRDAFSDKLVACLRTANVQREVVWTDLWFVEEKYIGHEEQYIKQNDILISTANSLELLGKVAMVKNVPLRATLGTFIVNLRPPKSINPKLVYFYLSSSEFRSKVQENASTTTNISNISTSKLKDIELPLAPLPEQERIVAKIDELFSELDKAIESLRTAQQQLKVYRQTVLKWAFEGRITGNSDANHKHVRLQELCHFITKGTTPSKGNLYQGSGEVPFIKVYNLTFSGRLDFSIEPTFVTNDTHNGFLARSKVLPGDVLMNIVGPPLGKVSIVPDTYPEWNINQAIARFRCKEQLSRKFLAYYLIADYNVEKMKKKAKATAGQFNLTLEICRDIEIPLIPIEDQNIIVQAIESRLSVCDKLEAAIEKSLVQAETLRQSILEKAFEGRLVPQDPNDEPAEKLLERIQAEREAQKSEKITTKRRTK